MQGNAPNASFTNLSDVNGGAAEAFGFAAGGFQGGNRNQGAPPPQQAGSFYSGAGFSGQGPPADGNAFANFADAQDQHNPIDPSQASMPNTIRKQPFYIVPEHLSIENLTDITEECTAKERKAHLQTMYGVYLSLIVFYQRAYWSGWLHKRASAWYMFWYVLMGVVSIAIGVVGAVLSFATISIMQDQPWISIIVGVCTILVTSLKVLENFLRFGEHRKAHQITEKQYFTFYYNLYSQILALRNSMIQRRVLNVMPTHNVVVSNYTKLYISQREVSNYIWKKLIRRATKLNVPQSQLPESSHNPSRTFTTRIPGFNDSPSDTARKPHHRRTTSTATQGGPPSPLSRQPRRSPRPSPRSSSPRTGRAKPYEAATVSTFDSFLQQPSIRQLRAMEEGSASLEQGSFGDSVSPSDLTPDMRRQSSDNTTHVVTPPPHSRTYHHENPQDRMQHRQSRRGLEEFLQQQGEKSLVYMEDLHAHQMPNSKELPLQPRRHQSMRVPSRKPVIQKEPVTAIPRDQSPRRARSFLPSHAPTNLEGNRMMSPMPPFRVHGIHGRTWDRTRATPPLKASTQELLRVRDMPQQAQIPSVHMYVKRGQLPAREDASPMASSEEQGSSEYSTASTQGTEEQATIITSACDDGQATRANMSAAPGPKTPQDTHAVKPNSHNHE